MEQPTPRITFTNDGVLLRRGYPIDGTDTSPEYVAELVNEYTHEIKNKMHELYETSKASNTNEQVLTRPTILIARLALTDEDKISVLTRKARSAEHSSIHTSPDSLEPEYKSFWHQIVKQTVFLPEVHEHRLMTQADGVWLGVHSIKKH